MQKDSRTWKKWYLIKIGKIIRLLAGYYAAEKGNYQKAFDFYRNALKKDPSDIAPMLGTGIACASAGFFLQAEKWFYRVIELDPDNSEAYFQLASLYCEVFNFSKAEMILETAVLMCPESSDCHFLCAQMKLQKGESEKAVSLFRKSMQLGLDEEDNRYAEFAIGEIALLSSEEKKGRFYFLDKDFIPEGTEEIRNAAFAHLDNGNLPMALKLFQLSSDFENASWISRIIRENSRTGGRDISLEKDLDYLIEICRKNRIRLIFLNYPDNQNKQLLYTAEKNQIPVADIFMAFCQCRINGISTKNMFLPDGHCSFSGNEVTAEKVAEKIISSAECP